MKNTRGHLALRQSLAAQGRSPGGRRRTTGQGQRALRGHHATRPGVSNALPTGLLRTRTSEESDQANEVRSEIRPHLGFLLHGQLCPPAAAFAHCLSGQGAAGADMPATLSDEQDARHAVLHDTARLARETVPPALTNNNFTLNPTSGEQYGDEITLWRVYATFRLGPENIRHPLSQFRNDFCLEPRVVSQPHEITRAGMRQREILRQILTPCLHRLRQCLFAFPA